MNIFTKFHKDWTTIVDFLLIAKFWACLLFFPHPLEDIIQRVKSSPNGELSVVIAPSTSVNPTETDVCHVTKYQ